MSNAIRISFGPCDPLNPGFGFEFMAESAKGVEMRADSHPDTGDPLTAHDCIALAQTFHGPDPEQEAGSSTRLIEENADGRNQGLEEAARLVEQNAVDHGSAGKVKRLIPGVRPCVTRSSYASAIRGRKK